MTATTAVLGLGIDSEAGLCAHCKLPLARSPWSRARPDEDGLPRYCCFGCKFAAAIVHERGEAGATQWMLTRLGLAIFFTMNVMAFTMALWTYDVYQADPSGLTPLHASLESFFRYLVMLMALPVALLLGWPLLDAALQALRRGVYSTDLLLSAGVAAAFVYSMVSVLRGRGPVYFEVGCVVLVMVTLGRWLEASGKLKANDALDRLARLLPPQVRRLRGDVEEPAALDAIARGDRLRVLAGERFPADGRLDRGRALVDEQVLTGESRSVLKQPGDRVLGGTLNLDGDLVLVVTAAGAEGTLARLISLVRQARAARGPYERLADRVSAAVFPALAAIALITFVGHAWTGGIERGLMQALAVVLIACPCALGLATPLAVSTALGRAAGAQVLLRSAESFERLATLRAIRFDKTGTLTTGTPRVSHFFSADGSADVLHHAAVLAAASSHPLSRVIVDFARDRAAREAVSEVQAIAGLGVVGKVGDPPVRTFLGSRRLMDELGLRIGSELQAHIASAESQGRSYALVGWEGHSRGLFVFEEELRADAVAALARCQALGLDLGVLTGDHAARGQALAAELGLAVEAGLLPAEKAAALGRVRAEIGPVAMVGDGINDAPALAASDLGVALGCGTDLARDSAAVCLLGDDLARLPWVIALARRTVGIIRGNLAWAFGYNSIGVLAAALGWLSPALAALLMVGSSLFVITNSLRLRRPGAGAMEAAG
jgi:heavy metal translocating P-type ATPase